MTDLLTRLDEYAAGGHEPCALNLCGDAAEEIRWLYVRLDGTRKARDMWRQKYESLKRDFEALAGVDLPEVDDDEYR